MQRFVTTHYDLTLVTGRRNFIFLFVKEISLWERNRILFPPNDLLREV